MTSTNPVVRNALAANYVQIGGRANPMRHTDDDTVGELMLGWTDIKRRAKFGDESSEREFGQKLKNLFERKRYELYDRASARKMEDALLREWNSLAKFYKLSGL